MSTNKAPEPEQIEVHEYGIVRSILGLVDDQVHSHAGKRATRIVVGIEGGHIDESFLKDAFNAFKVDTTAREAELVVVSESASEIWCPACGVQVISAAAHLACPQCGSPGVPMKSADEIYLKSVEIEV